MSLFRQIRGIAHFALDPAAATKRRFLEFVWDSYVKSYRHAGQEQLRITRSWSSADRENALNALWKLYEIPVVTRCVGPNQPPESPLEVRLLMQEALMVFVHALAEAESNGQVSPNYPRIFAEMKTSLETASAP
jgi:hypothetical protein